MATEKCITKNCKNKSHSRGLCPKCYSRFRYHVKRDETTWLELEQLGLIGPSNKTIDLIYKARAAKGGK